MSGLKAVGMAALGAFAVMGVGTVLIVSGAFGTPSKNGSNDAVAGEPVAAHTPSAAASGSLAKLYKKVQDGVVYVQATTAEGQASGSGVVLDADGHIVTNEHVVDGATTLQVRVGEKGKLVDAQLLGADAGTDLAVLKVDPSQTGKLHPLELGDSSDVAVGQSVIAIGSPYGLQGTLTSGIISATGRDIQSPSGQTISGAIQTDAAINPGNSGGPLLNKSGQVLGINAQIATESGASAGVGFAIPIDIVKKAIPQLEAGQGSGTTTDQGQAQSQGQDQSQDPSQSDPYGLQQQDPSQQQSDPYGEQDPQSQLDQVPNTTQEDPYGDQTQTDPYGDPSQGDPYGDPSQGDPYGDQSQADPSQADPYGLSDGSDDGSSAQDQLQQLYGG